MPITVPIDSPPWRTERKSEIMSCAAPMNTQPRTIQSATDAQPNSAARTGPMIGPAPAMAAKWCPNRTVGCAGTKSTPSLRVCAGVGRDGSAPSFFSMNLA